MRDYEKWMRLERCIDEEMVKLKYVFCCKSVDALLQRLQPFFFRREDNLPLLLQQTNTDFNEFCKSKNRIMFSLTFHEMKKMMKGNNSIEQIG